MSAFRSNISRVNGILFLANMAFFATWCLTREQNIISMVTQETDLHQQAVKKKESILLRENKTWCVLPTSLMGKTAGLFQHFPHAVENILPCWSGFIERGAVAERKTDDNTYEFESNCGIFLLLKNYEQTAPSYVMEVIKAMGCEVVFGNRTFKDIDQLSGPDDYFTPNIYLRTPRYKQIIYVNEPIHAHMLRRRFVSDELIKAKKGNGKPLQIGLLQRSSGTRVIENMQSLQVELQKALPKSNVTHSEFKYTKVKDQAVWFATKDVIVGSHGAAMINSMFITPKTIVMQMYPPGWFWNSMEPLVEQAGGIAIQWYAKGKDPMLQHLTDFNTRNKALMSNFSVPIGDVVQHVMYALGEWPANVHHLAKLYQIDEANFPG